MDIAQLLATNRKEALAQLNHLLRTNYPKYKAIVATLPPDERHLASRRESAYKYRHSEKGKAYHKKYRRDNADCIKIANQKYYINTREARLAYAKKYREESKVALALKESMKCKSK